jgi:hypothetical protein
MRHGRDPTTTLPVAPYCRLAYTLSDAKVVLLVD